MIQCASTLKVAWYHTRYIHRTMVGVEVEVAMYATLVIILLSSQSFCPTDFFAKTAQAPVNNTVLTLRMQVGVS